MKITVIGSGTMGNGIAHTGIQYQHDVCLYDLSTKQLEKGLASIEQNLSRQVEKNIISSELKQNALNRIKVTNSLADAVKYSDIVIEAIAEKKEVKTELYHQIEKFCPAHTLLASNTSSISITQLAAATTRPDKFIGMHFMNPVPVMKLVEVIRGYATSDETCATVMQLSADMGKSPVLVNDYPGFISNRILMPMINEAIWSLMQGVAGVEEIDSIMKMGMAHPMGPLQLADFIGLDVCLYILKVMQDGFGDPKYAPCPLLVNMVEAGHKGVKSGIGFYKYTAGSKELVVSPRFKRS